MFGERSERHQLLRRHMDGGEGSVEEVIFKLGQKE